MHKNTANAGSTCLTRQSQAKFGIKEMKKYHFTSDHQYRNIFKLYFSGHNFYFTAIHLFMFIEQ